MRPLASWRKNFFIFFLLLGGILLLAAPPARAIFLGEIKPGLRFVEQNKKTGYFLYVPEGFTQQKKWPLILGFAEWGTDIKKYAELWAGEADKRGYIVLCPQWWKSRDTVPDKGDRAVLKILNKIIKELNVDPAKILVTGFSDGGDYAYYLALRYPKRFSASAVLGGALGRNYDNLVFYGRVRRKPVSFYIRNGKDDLALEDRQHTWESIRKEVANLRGLGLDVDYGEIDGLGHEYRKNFNPQIIDWFETKQKG